MKVLIDNFTRFVRLTSVKSTSSQNVLRSLKELVNDFGLPERIISDRGSCFTSKQFEEYCTENGIKHTLNSTKHPQANYMVERANRTILSTITTSMATRDHKDWDAKIKIVERNLNNFVNNTTNKMPFEMLHGYSPRFNDGIIRQLADDDAEEYKDPKAVQNEVKEIIEEKQSKIKAYYDRKKCRTLKFERGEIVVMRRQPMSTGQPTKTQPKYRGPFIIVKVLPNDMYKVTQLEEKEKGHFFATTAHVSQLKPWRIYDDENESQSDSDEGEESRRNQPKRNVKRAI